MFYEDRKSDVWRTENHRRCLLSGTKGDYSSVVSYWFRGFLRRRDLFHSSLPTPDVVRSEPKTGCFSDPLDLFGWRGCRWVCLFPLDVRWLKRQSASLIRGTLITGEFPSVDVTDTRRLNVLRRRTHFCKLSCLLCNTHGYRESLGVLNWYPRYSYVLTPVVVPQGTDGGGKGNCLHFFDRESSPRSDATSSIHWNSFTHSDPEEVVLVV